jgi:hypothetical protein
MTHKKAWFLFSIIIILLLIPNAAKARESRVIAGDGVLTEDTELVESIWRLGLCEIIPNDEYGFEVANMAYSVWPSAFADSGVFSTIRLDSINPATLTPDDIIQLGQEYELDALVCGVIGQAKVRDSLLGSAVRIEIAFQMYETTTGTLIWERTLKKNRTVNESEVVEIIRRFAGNVSTDMVPVLIADGVTGRDISANEPPGIHCSHDSLNFVTSAIRLCGTVTDDFGIADFVVLCGNNEEPLLSVALESQSLIDFDIILTWADLEEDEIIITASDSQGQHSELIIPIEDDEPFITGQIANISSDRIFVNLGTINGIEEGMVFIVVSDEDIIDPTTDRVLGQSTLNVGIIQVEAVEDEFSTCIVLDGEIDNFSVGDKVY